MNAHVLNFPTAPAPPASCRRQALSGGTFDPVRALQLMNDWFFVSEQGGEVGVYRIEDDGTITFLSPDHLKLLLANVFVNISPASNQSAGKLITIDKFWLCHHQRRGCSRIVFRPDAKTDEDEYNLWRGFAVLAKSGFQKQRRLIQHIYRVICKCDKIKFKYLMKWLAWTVQNPHRHAEVMVVLQSNVEGSGKSTLGSVMLDIFGPRHGLLVDDKDQLLGHFNSHLETTCFVLGEEVLWAGDARTADALKSRITAGTITIEAKYRQRRQVPNRLHVMLTTNHSWAISAGVKARRYFVVEVSDEVAQDPDWFGPLYRDLAEGGTAEFLGLLKSLKLGSWHPREVPKTNELVDQQILSAGSIHQWLLACADYDSVAGKPDQTAPIQSLGCDISTAALYDAYCAYSKQRAARVESQVMFGRVLTAMFGAGRRLPAGRSGKRPMGYSIPKADAVRQAVLAELKTAGA